MKRIAFVIFCFLSILSTHAQEPAVQEYTFSDIVVADSLDKASLYSNALKWVLSSKDPKTVAQDSINGKITGVTTFSVYAQSGVLSKLSGKITFDFLIEVKDSKYRYSFDNFIFHYYKQNRNYKMVETGQTRSLNEKKAVGWQKLWDQHRATTTMKLTTEIADLRKQIVFRPKKIKPATKKVEW